MQRIDKRSFDEISTECRKLPETEMSDDLDYLFAKGGSSGGVRPKILTKVDGQDWIIKFPSSDDRKDIGKLEYDYALCAAKRVRSYSFIEYPLISYIFKYLLVSSTMPVILMLSASTWQL